MELGVPHSLLQQLAIRFCREAASNIATVLQVRGRAVGARSVLLESKFVSTASGKLTS